MKKICRNLSIVAMVIIIITAIILVVKAINKPRDKEIYATSVKFKTTAGAVEIYSQNKIVLSKDLVTIKPADCTLVPEFWFKRYGQSGETQISETTHKFEDEGKYILICRVKSGDTYYNEDRLTIDVVDTPRETTSFYIQKLNVSNLYIDEDIALDKIVGIKKSANSSITVECDENLKYNNGIITPLKQGDTKITIVLKDNDITICQEISLKINPSVVNAKVELKLTLGGQVLSDNVVEKKYSQYNFDIGYTLVNLDRNQAIDCWTDGDVVEVIKFNSPTITIKALRKGTTTLYVVPLERPDLTFEIIVSII